MSNNNNQSTLKSNGNAQTQSRREQYTTYVKEHNLETLISEMTNSVVHALSPNPILYMIKYLTGLLSEDDRTAYGINIPPPYPQGVPIVHYPKFKSKNMLSKHLTKHKWQDLKYIKTKYNNNINTLTKLNETCPSTAIGIALMDGDCLYCYDTLLTDIICDYHELPRTRELNADDSVDQSSDEDKATNECKEYYKSGAFVTVSKDDLCFVETLARAKRVRFEFARNVDGYSFNNSTKNNGKVKEDIVRVVNGLLQEKVIDVECKVMSEKEEYEEVLKEYFSGEIEWMKNCGMDDNDRDTVDEDAETLPASNRLVFVSEDRSIIILVNFMNHFTLLVSTTDDNKDVIATYNKAVNILKCFSLNLQLEVHPQFGYVTSDIAMLGAGMRIHCDIPLPQDYTTYLNVIQSNSFSLCSINKATNTLHIEHNYKLKYNDEISFISHTLSTIAGIITLLHSPQSTRAKLHFDELAITNATIDKSDFALAYKETFASLRYTLSSHGMNINSIISQYNDTAMFSFNDKYDYYTFYPFIVKYLQLAQDFNIDMLNHINKPEKPRDITNITDKELLMNINSVNICLRRNIKSFPFSAKCSNETKQRVESVITTAISTVNSKGHFADYLPLYRNDTAKTAYDVIKSRNLLLEDEDVAYKGVIRFEKENVFAIVNDVDHLKVFYSRQSAIEDVNLGKELVNLIKVMNEFCKYVKFEYDNKFGFFTACPRFIGTGMHMEVKLKLDKMSKEEINAWIEGKGFKWRYVQGKDKQVLMENKATIGKTETEMLCNLLFYVRDVLEENRKG